MNDEEWGIMAEASVLSVLYEQSDGIARLRLNRPQVLNALDHGMVQDINRAVSKAAEDTKVRCVVIDGAGDHFMAGGDLKAFSRQLQNPPEDRRRYFKAMIDELHPAIQAINDMPKPVIASVRGAAAGFGFSLVLATDLALAAEDAYFTMAYCLIGTTPDGGGTYHLPRLLGLKQSMEIALLGGRLSAQEAKELGLINRVVPTGELEAETNRLAARLAEGPAVTLGRTKALLRQSINRTLPDQLAMEAELFSRCAAGAEFAEGITAFLDKRKADFVGKGED